MLAVAYQTLLKGERLSTSRTINQKKKAEYKLFGHDDRPKGDEIHLQNAKAFLGPFHRASAGADQYELSEQCAEEDICGTAVVYNGHRQAAASAPRLNAPRQRLAAIAQKADELRDLIATMGEMERAMYEVAGQVKEVPHKLYSRAKGDWLPRSSVEPWPDSESKWLSQLDALSELSREVLAIYNQKFGPDVGGRTNVHTELFSSPEHTLIKYGWEIFERFKPKEASTSDTGAFHLFLQQIYEYATGRGANEDGAPALVPKIKRMLEPLRKYAANLDQLRRADEMEAQFLSRLTNGASLEELEVRIKELKRGHCGDRP
jgi:hypothetical protein